ncbi:hypothetical protein [Microbacterium sp. NPDC055683]
MSRPSLLRRMPVLALAAALIAAALVPFSTAPADAASAPRITDPVTMYDASWVVVTFASASTTVTYTAKDENGAVAGSGSGWAYGGKGTLDLTALGPGYYDLTITDAAGSTTTSIGVVAQLKASTDTSRFGTTAHPDIHAASVDQTAAADAVGVATVRVDWRWETASVTRSGVTQDAKVTSEVDRLLAAGIRPVLVLAYYGSCDGGKTPSSRTCIAAYADFAAKTARIYGTRVDYAVYNEPNAATNTSTCGKTPACYIALLKPAYQAIKAAVPGATVTGPAVGAADGWWDEGGQARAWFAEFAALGGLAYVDQVTIHAYTLASTPEGKGENAVRAAKEIMAKAGRDLPLVVEEAGYTTATGGLPEHAAGAFLVRDAALVLAAGATRYMPYNLIDAWNAPDNAAANFGLFHHEDVASGSVSPKHAAVTMAVLSRFVQNGVLTVEETGNDDVHSVKVTWPDGRVGRIVWAVAQAHAIAIADGGTVTVKDVYGDEASATAVANLTVLAVGGHPVYLTGTAAGTLQVLQ